MSSVPKSVTTQTLAKMAREGDAIAMLTAYDFPTAAALDAAGVDVLTDSMKYP